MRKDISEADVRSAVEKFPLSMKKAAEYLDIPYRTFIERAKKYGAYKPNPSGLGTNRGTSRRDYKITPIEEIFDGMHPTYDVATLKRRLVADNIIEYKCVVCGNDGTWLGNPITLQLNHINGNRHDHSLENLEFLCPNCHTQTETWGGRNKLRKTVTDEEIIKSLKETKTIYEAIANLGMSKSTTTYNRFRDLKLSLHTK